MPTLTSTGVVKFSSIPKNFFFHSMNIQNSNFFVFVIVSRPLYKLIFHFWIHVVWFNIINMTYNSVLFLIHDYPCKHILYVKFTHVSVLLCINHWCQYYWLCFHCWICRFLLENILLLRSSVGHCLPFTWSISLFLEKYNQSYCLFFLLSW